MEDGKITPVTRRSFIEKAGIATLASASLATAVSSETSSAPNRSSRPRPRTYYATQRLVQEWGFTSGKAYADPFNQVELDASYRPPGAGASNAHLLGGRPNLAGAIQRGEDRKVYLSTVSNDVSDPDLHDQEGEIMVSEYKRDNSVLKHGTDPRCTRSSPL